MYFISDAWLGTQLDRAGGIQEGGRGMDGRGSERPGWRKLGVEARRKRDRADEGREGRRTRGRRKEERVHRSNEADK